MYNPKIWYDGDVVTSGGLNNMEQGIAQNAQDIEDLQGALGGDMESYVDDWLDSHPEATTTVQNGSLTVAKFSQNLAKKTVKDFVTPEMYGAVGDGVTDDTEAIQSAIDNAGNNSVVFGKLSYKITSPIEVKDKNKFVLDCQKSTITYTGNDYAFVLEHIQNTDILIGEIQAASGGCIKCIASDSNNSQYVNIRFKLLYGATDDIFCHVTGIGWFNEVRLYDGRLSGTGNGVRILNEKTDAYVSSWRFINVGFEGRNSSNPLAVGVYLDATNPSAIGFAGFNFISVRAAESFTKLFYTRGNCIGFLIAGGKISRYFIDVDSGADGWTIITGEHTDYIKNGMFFDDGAYHFASGANTDLNNIKTTGTYFAPTNAIASSISNCPVDAAFNLYVYYGAVSDRIIQLLETYAGTFVIRYYLTSSNTWSEWTGIRGYSKTIVTNDDLDTFLTPQKYACTASTIAESLSHCPVSVSFGLEVETVSSTNVLIQTLVPNQAEPVVYRRIYRNNAWGSWYRFSGTAI